MTKIIAGSNSRQLTKHLSKDLGITQIKASIERFEDQELRVQLTHGVHEEDVIIVQSTSKPANDHLIELLLLVDAAKRSGARRVIALVPYFGYSRQDRPLHPFSAVSASLVATLIEAAGVDHLITVDLHSEQAENFFKIDMQNIETTALFADLLRDQTNLIIVSPDTGGVTRASKLSRVLGLDLAVIKKIRESYNTCQMSELIGDVTGKHCVLIDDIIDTGGTLCKAVQLLMQQGALSVEAFVTHAVLSGQAVANIKKSAIKKITITGTIEQKNLPHKFAVVDIALLVRKTLEKMV